MFCSWIIFFQQNLKSWATALGLAWLHKYFLGAHTEWEMIEYKGLKWLEAEDLQMSVDDLRKTAAAMV